MSWGLWLISKLIVERRNQRESRMWAVEDQARLGVSKAMEDRLDLPKWVRAKTKDGMMLPYQYIQVSVTGVVCLE